MEKNKLGQIMHKTLTMAKKQAVLVLLAFESYSTSYLTSSVPD